VADETSQRAHGISYSFYAHYLSQFMFDFQEDKMGKNFTAKIDRKIERFRQEEHQTLEAEVANKRIAWFKRNYQGKSDGQPPSPRAAYELLFFEYLGLPEKEVAVLSETDTKIVWSSTNSCPTLAACKKGGLDTKTICRAIYEKSTQAFVSQLDPQLRFHRSYEEIVFFFSRLG
jgi:hypothetical protein